ncbi:MAG TPA: lysylphosphatidylglycerol synthase transmembrane domain-containing protein [Ktedonobacteraceae bacterium]|nr:lysylphosphatidylglycerol synthase transmembrane domain-containing protein [Ktedonobacteraceae bacterium]
MNDDVENTHTVRQQNTNAPPVSSMQSDSSAQVEEQAVVLPVHAQNGHSSIQSIPAAQTQEQEPEITREQLSLGKRLLNWRTLLPLAVVIVAIIYFVHNSHIDLQKTWAAMRSANIVFLLAAFVIYYLSFPLRTLRWRLLLENVGFTKAQGVELPRFGKLLEIIFISWFANAIVPAKLGDLYRAYLLHQETGVSGSRSFGTVIAERLLDLIVLLLLFISSIIISLHANLPWQLRLGLEITLVAVVAGIIVLLIMRQFPAQIVRLIPARFRPYYTHFYEGTLGSFRRLPTLIGLTLSVWACEALRFFFVALSLNLIGGDLLHILTAAMFIALGEALLTVVPFTGGGVGLVEGGMLAMIVLFTQGMPNELNVATAAILLDRTISLFSILIFGFIVFMIAFGQQATKSQKKS